MKIFDKLKGLFKEPEKIGETIQRIKQNPQEAGKILDGALKNPEEITAKLKGLFKDPEQVGETIEKLMKNPKEALQGILKSPEEIEKLGKELGEKYLNNSATIKTESKKLAEIFKPLKEKGFFRTPTKELGSKIKSAVARTPVIWGAAGAAVLGTVAVIANHLLGGGNSPQEPAKQIVQQEKDIVQA